MSVPTPYYTDDAVTLYHGDALDILPELTGIGAVVTDPPYSSGGAFRGDRARSTVEKYVQTSTTAYRPEFAGDNRDQRSFLVWASLWLNAARRASVDGAVLASFIDWRQLPTMSDAIQVGGWIWRGIAPWVKPFGRPTPGRFSNASEFVIWGSNGPMPPRDAYPRGWMEHGTPQGERHHITQKPEPVMRWVLELVPPGALVLDPFMGSGTTLVAAKSKGLRAIGIDCQESNCETAAKRCTQDVLALGGADGSHS